MAVNRLQSQASALVRSKGATRQNLRILSLAQNTGLILAFALMTALAAQIQVHLPFTPVPITMQTAAVLFTGLALGWRRGAISQAFYLIAGATGAPFFALPGGLHLMGPTAGYLLGFLPMVVAAGLVKRVLADKPLRNGSMSTSIMRPFWAFVGSVLASLPCLALGSFWLKAWLSLSWSQALAMGVTPFLVGDLIKVSVAVAAAELAWRLNPSEHTKNY